MHILLPRIKIWCLLNAVIGRFLPSKVPGKLGRNSSRYLLAHESLRSVYFDDKQQVVRVPARFVCLYSAELLISQN